MVLNEEQAIDIIKGCQSTSREIEIARQKTKELFALIEGDDFANELIKKIEFLESGKKAEARKKYSRDVQDFFERLFQPINNVFNSTGGERTYKIANEQDKIEVLKKVADTRDNKSLSKWLEDTWMPLFHTDPNGVLLMEYTEENVWPTYKTIYSIRKYLPKGQKLEWILFEPVDVEDSQYWRLIDDEKDWTIKQTGEAFVIVEDKTFEHPFGEVPAVINSNLIKLGTEEYRLSPVSKILDLSKEYARDQSIKTIYKFLHGMPKEWRYVAQCNSCRGTKKNGDGGSCGDCDGRGYISKNDVTDLITLPIPKGDQPVLAPNIAGHITPDLETWDEYRTEGSLLEDMTHRTFWGTTYGLSNDKQGEKTATEIRYNLQPMINRLNFYTNSAEFIESQITYWIAKFINPNYETSEENFISIHYGRRYILSSPDDIIRMYNEAKEQGDNNVVLDRLLNEFITAKYKNNPQDLRQNLLKSKVEPYVHLSFKEVNEFFGNKETQRKNLFTKWWDLEADKTKPAKDLIKDYDIWFNTNFVPLVPEQSIND
jgi:hypothetical protein